MTQHPARTASRVLGVALVASLVLASLPAGASARPGPRARLDPRLVTQLERATAREKLVAFVHGDDIGAVHRALRQARIGPLASLAKVGVAVVAATPAQLRRLATSPEVDFLEADRPIRMLLDRATRATRVDEALAGFTSGGRKIAGVDGSGVSIGIVDTGIDGTHPMFAVDGASKVVRNVKMACVDHPVPVCPSQGPIADAAFVDATAVNDTDTGSIGGHGTHVAGIAGGVDVTSTNGARMHGAAPGAKLVAVSMGAFLSVYAGAVSLNWILEHHRAPCGPRADPKACPPIKVINNSWSIVPEGEPFDPERAIPKIEHALVAEGVTVVWAAGNSGGGGQDETTTSDANSRRPGILSVANFDDADSGARHHILNPSSSRGERGVPDTYPDISAPGTNVLSACRPNLALCRVGGPSIDPNYASFTGTSMAAPHVAGIVALLLDANPRLTPAQIEDVLEDTAHRFVFGGAYEKDPFNTSHPTSYDKGHGLVDAVSAVARARNVPAPRAARECTAGAPLLVDPPGDGDAASMGFPGTTDTDLDVVEGDARWDGKTFTTRVRFAPTSTGVPQSSRIDVAFDYAHRTYTTVATRDGSGGWSFTMQAPDGSPLTVPISGRYVAARREVVMSWPTAAFNRATSKPAPPVPAMGRGSFVGPFEIATQRPFGASASDRVKTACFLQLGAGPHLRPAIWDRLPVRFDVTLSKENVADDWSPKDVTGVGFIGDFTGMGQGVVERAIKVIPASERSSLTVTITPDSSFPSDFDLYVYGPDGAVASSAGTSSNEEVRITGVRPGVYIVEVATYLAIAGTYRARAVLSP